MAISLKYILLLSLCIVAMSLLDGVFGMLKPKSMSRNINASPLSLDIGIRRNEQGERTASTVREINHVNDKNKPVSFQAPIEMYEKQQEYKAQHPSLNRKIE